MREHKVLITQDNLKLPGLLTVPEQPQGIVLFAHGSGSSPMVPSKCALFLTR